MYQDLVRETPVAEPILKYAVTLAATSRPQNKEVPQFIKDYVSWGSSIRGAHYLILAAKARAVLAGRPHVSVQDIQAVALPVLRNRIITNFHAVSEGIDADEVVRRLLKAVPTPSSGL
jgi:MoxR-like ATPase